MAHPHSRVGASSSERWWNCPGSVEQVANCPPQPESSYAKEGTAAHKLAERCLKENCFPQAFFDQEIVPGIKVNEAMIEAVETYIEVIKADIEQYGLSMDDLQVERQFQLTQIHPAAFGTNDANLPVFLTKVIVYDFKYGSGVAVDAEDNKQGMYYALGASIEGDYDEFEIVIVQPRAIHKFGPIRRWAVSKADLARFGQELKAHILATMRLDHIPPLNCGPWCKKTFCPAMICCPSFKKFTQESALVVFDDAAIVPPKPETLTPDQLKRVLDAMPLIDAYLKAIESYANSIVNNGGKVPGYKLVAKRSNRQWKDEKEVIKKFGKKVAVKIIEETKSPAALETTLKESMKPKEAKAAVEPFTFKPDTGSVLVPMDDPREEVRPKLEQTFTDESLFS